MNDTLVIDFQGFKDSDNQFIIKELAGYDGYRLFHLLFQSPFSQDVLSQKLQESNKWNTNNYHCLKWDIGFTPYPMVIPVLHNNTLTYAALFVKGREKANWLRTFLDLPILELPEHPPLKKSKPLCIYHDKQHCMCALTNVINLYNTFCSEITSYKNKTI